MSISPPRALQMNEADLLRLAVEMLHQSFHACTRVDAKRRFRALESGKRVALTELRSKEPGGPPLRITLALDTTELRGSLNFTLLRDLTGRLIARSLVALRQNGPFNSFSDQQGRTLFLLPAAGGLGDHVNVMVIAINGSHPGEIGIELMCLDPEQFRAEQQAESAAVAANGSQEAAQSA